jgi:hypothetical protein
VSALCQAQNGFAARSLESCSADISALAERLKYLIQKNDAFGRKPFLLAFNRQHRISASRENHHNFTEFSQKPPLD